MFNKHSAYIVIITMRPQRESEEIDDLWEAVDNAILEEFSQAEPKPVLPSLKNKKVG